MGCYSGSRAAQDINLAWRGHARVELEARLGAPATLTTQPAGATALRWTRRGHDVRLPSGHLKLDLTPTSFQLDAAARPGEIRSYDYDIAAALVDPTGRVLQFDSGWVVAGIPSGLNARTGVVFGLSFGMGTLDDATTPLPSLSTYIGGMIGPRLALVGAYTFVNGSADGAYIHGHAWAVAAQYWATERLSLRAGPAMVIDVDPMPGSAKIRPGGVGAVSFAIVRAGSFVLDVRADATMSTSSAFGMLGLGVNVN
ncbi:MAG: hypothetical protein ACKV2T_32125 [Kofleriaceae bacterium]